MSTFEKIRKAALARLEAGEPVHIILQDYADFEDELRPVLENATGKSLSGSSSPVIKAKGKNAPKMSILPVILAAMVIVAIGAAAAIFVLMPTDSEVITPQTVTNCIGIPQAQITSLYAQQGQQQNTNSVSSSTTGSGGGFGDDMAYESAEEVREIGDVDDAPPVMPDTVGGSSVTTDSTSTGSSASSSSSGSSSTGGGYDSTGETTSSAGAPAGLVISATPAPAIAGMEVEDDAVAMVDMEEEAPPAPMDESSRSSTASDDYDYDVADGDVAYAPEPVNISTEPLRAGEIDDNAEWDDYQDYRNDYLDTYGVYSVRDVDTTGRQVIRVVDSEGNPVLNACVEIYHGDTHINTTLTYATGMTMFFPNLSDQTGYVDTFRVVVSKGNVMEEATLDRDVVGGVTTIELPITQQYDRVQLDVMFLLDATGSMGDEIEQLQGNILTISDQINNLPDNIDVRYGLVTYRDRGDQYVTRVYDFTDDIDEFQENLVNVRAAGGGDYPESLNEGLDMALNAVEWRMDDTVRLAFLVADAPPHVDYEYDADYSLLMQDALARGIKIHQIASGGLEPEGEFVMRQIAQYTMGRFLFLTYEDGVVGTSGDERPDLEVGSPEDEQGVGDYSVSQLDELVLRLITDEIAALRGE